MKLCVNFIIPDHAIKVPNKAPTIFFVPNHPKMFCSRIFERGNKNDHIVGFIKVKHLFDQDECHIQIESIAHHKTISAITYPTWKFHKQMADLSNES